MSNFITDDFIGYMKSVEGTRKKRGKHYVYSSAEGGRGTIGYGHKLKKGENFGAGLTENQALALLEKDLNIAAKGVSRHIGKDEWSGLSGQQRQMLVDYQFNLKGGIASFPKFRDAVIARDYDTMEREYKRNYKTSSGEWKPIKDRNEKFYNKYLSDDESGMWGIQTMAQTEPNTDVRLKGAFESIKGRKESLEKDLMDPLRRERESKPEKDLFSGMSSDDYLASSEHGQKKLEESYRGFISKGMKLLHAPAMREKIFKILQNKNPIEAVANVSLGIINKIDQAIGKSGQKVPDEIKLAAANNIMGQVIEVGEASGLVTLDENEKQVAFSQAVNMYLQGEIKAGRIDGEKLAEANGQSVNNMTPEQRGQLDTQLKQINQTAMAAEKKYGIGGAGQQVAQPEQEDITQMTGGSNGLLA